MIFAPSPVCSATKVQSLRDDLHAVVILASTPSPHGFAWPPCIQYQHRRSFPATPPCLPAPWVSGTSRKWVTASLLLPQPASSGSSYLAAAGATNAWIVGAWVRGMPEGRSLRTRKRRREREREREREERERGERQQNFSFPSLPSFTQPDSGRVPQRSLLPPTSTRTFLLFAFLTLH